MSQLINEVERKIKELKKVKAFLEESLSSEIVPAGKLRISQKGNKKNYYHITQKQDTNGKYISRNNMELIRGLAQKEYNRKLLGHITIQLKTLEKFQKGYNPSVLEADYDELNEYRKELIKPLILSNKKYIENWMNMEYIGNPYNPEEKRYMTDRGEYVRSKSELLIANEYYEKGIPYKYEAPIILDNGKVKYPDFTLLHPETRKIIYHEHLGLLDNEQYRYACMKKIADYMRNGIYLGYNLIITFESEKLPLDIISLKQMIDTTFKRRH